jgi:hypothetical protein
MEKNTRITVISGIVLVAGLVTYKLIARNRNTTLNTLKAPLGNPQLDEAPPIEDMGIYSDREIAAKKAAEEKKANEYTSEQLAEDLYKAFKGYGTSWAQGNTGGVTGIIARMKTDEDFDALNEAYGIRTLNSGFLNLFSKDYTGDMNGAFNSELTLNEIIKVNKILEDNGVTRRILPIPKFD